MAPIGIDAPIQLLPGQVVDNDPDGLIEHDRKWLAELMKPRTIELPPIIFVTAPLRQSAPSDPSN